MARVGIEKNTLLSGRSQRYFPKQCSLLRIAVFYIFCSVILNNNVCAQHGRVAPGVPPQKYQEIPSSVKQGICGLVTIPWNKYLCSIIIKTRLSKIVKLWYLTYLVADEIKFHDPTEFAQQDNLQQQNINQQQQVNQPNINNLEPGSVNLEANENPQEAINKPHAPHSHQKHGHGIGDSVDAE